MRTHTPHAHMRDAQFCHPVEEVPYLRLRNKRNTQIYAKHDQCQPYDKNGITTMCDSASRYKFHCRMSSECRILHSWSFCYYCWRRVKSELHACARVSACAPARARVCVCVWSSILIYMASGTISAPRATWKDGGGKRTGEKGPGACRF